MKPDMLPALLWILHTEDHEMSHIAKITRMDITDGATSNFHPDGLFSTRIFGLVGSTDRDTVYGRIDLKVRVLHPKVHRELIGLRELYKFILDGTKTAKFDPVLGDFVPSMDEDAETGYSFFIRHLPNLVLKPTNSPARNARIKFLTKWRHRMTTKNVPVMPAGLRDVEQGDDGRLTKHEINDLYWRLLATTNTIIPSSDMESPVYDQARKVLAQVYREIYEMLENVFGGKKGYFKDKYLSRRVREGTRNVFTSMNTSGLSLDAPNVPGFDATVLGTHQAAVTLAPKVIHWMKVGFVGKLLGAAEGSVPLIDPETLETRYVDLDPVDRDRWTTEDGLRTVIHNLVDLEARHRPVVIQGHYLALIYLGDGTFKVFDDIRDLPEGFDRASVYPLSLMQLIYLSGYSKWGEHYTEVVRYPIAGDNSTYPSKIYIKTTSVGEIRRELGDDWQPQEGDKFLAVEFPKMGLRTYHDSESPHPSWLKALGADFDGDTGSATSVMLKDSIDEIRRYLTTREAWVRPDGRMRASVVYDTSELVVRNLTGRFNHVVQLDKKDYPLLPEWSNQKLE